MNCINFQNFVVIEKPKPTLLQLSKMLENI